MKLNGKAVPNAFVLRCSDPQSDYYVAQRGTPYGGSLVWIYGIENAKIFPSVDSAIEYLKRHNHSKIGVHILRWQTVH